MRDKWNALKNYIEKQKNKPSNYDVIPQCIYEDILYQMYCLEDEVEHNEKIRRKQGESIPIKSKLVVAERKKREIKIDEE